jgi:hypothetical protein
MKNGRTLMKILCIKKHRIGEVTAGPEGAVLRVARVTLADSSEASSRGYRKDAGDSQERLLVDDPFYRNDGLEVTCTKCGAEYRFYPLDIKRLLDMRETVTIVQPTRKTPR